LFKLSIYYSSSLSSFIAERNAERQHALRGAGMAVNSVTKNGNDMLLWRKYCSNDDTSLNTNPKLPSQPLT